MTPSLISSSAGFRLADPSVDVKGLVWLVRDGRASFDASRIASSSFSLGSSGARIGPLAVSAPVADAGKGLGSSASSLVGVLIPNLAATRRSASLHAPRVWLDVSARPPPLLMPLFAAFLILNGSRTVLHHRWTFFSPQPAINATSSGLALIAVRMLPKLETRPTASVLLILRGTVINSTSLSE